MIFFTLKSFAVENFTVLELSTVLFNFPLFCLVLRCYAQVSPVLSSSPLFSSYSAVLSSFPFLCSVKLSAVLFNYPIFYSIIY
jgi:hypothetical protein